MARKQNDGLAVICPVDGFATRGYVGMPCPDCGTEMIEDADVVDHDRALAGVSKDEPLDDELIHANLESPDQDPYGADKSFEDMLDEEFRQDEAEGEHY